MAPRMLGVLRPAARLLTGSAYAAFGYEILREPGPRVEEAAAFLASIREQVPLPLSDEQGGAGDRRRSRHSATRAAGARTW